MIIEPESKPTETDHWKVTSGAWKPKPGGGYQTPGTPAPVGDLDALNAWIHDTREWGIMMYEAVLDLRERVERLEQRAEVQAP